MLTYLGLLAVLDQVDYVLATLQLLKDLHFLLQHARCVVVDELDLENPPTLAAKRRGAYLQRRSLPAVVHVVHSVDLAAASLAEFLGHHPAFRDDLALAQVKRRFVLRVLHGSAPVPKKVDEYNE